MQVEFFLFHGKMKKGQKNIRVILEKHEDKVPRPLTVHKF